MVDDNDTAEAADPATAAFLRLEGEVALMRLAVEKLAIEKADIDIPDYNDTLTEISQDLGTLSATMEDILAKPAMGLTPENMAQRMTDAARSGREADRGRIENLQSLYNGAVQELRSMVARAHVAADQRERVIWASSGGVLAGCLIWSILPGVIARSLPSSWSVPETHECCASHRCGKAEYACCVLEARGHGGPFPTPQPYGIKTRRRLLPARESQLRKNEPLSAR